MKSVSWQPRQPKSRASLVRLRWGNVVEDQLHDRNVDPTSVAESHLPLDADDFVAESKVVLDTCDVGCHDACRQMVIVQLSGPRDHRLLEC